MAILRSELCVVGVENLWVPVRRHRAPFFVMHVRISDVDNDLASWIVVTTQTSVNFELVAKMVLVTNQSASASRLHERSRLRSQSNLDSLGTFAHQRLLSLDAFQRDRLVVKHDQFGVTPGSYTESLLENTSNLVDVSLAVGVVDLGDHVRDLAGHIVVLLEVRHDLGAALFDAATRRDLFLELFLLDT